MLISDEHYPEMQEEMSLQEKDSISQFILSSFKTNKHSLFIPITS